MKIQDQLRAAWVTRWHIVRTQRAQTVAEHLWNTSMIALNLWRTLSLPADSCSSLLWHAMTHDLEEAIIGDVPSPTKDKLRAESNKQLRLNFALPLPPCGPTDCTDLIVAVTKVADVMEAIWFITHEGVGYHPHHVRDYLFSKLEDTVDRLCLILDVSDSEAMYDDIITPMLDQMICVNWGHW